MTKAKLLVLIKKIERLYRYILGMMSKHVKEHCLL